MKYFVCSDIHGYYEELVKALEKAGFNKNNDNHKLIVIGDCFDRGKKSLEVYLYLKGLTETNKAIVIKGNHELFLYEIVELNEKRVKFNIEHNGFQFTLNSFCGEDVTGWELVDIKNQFTRQNPEIISWLDSLPFYFETDNYIFTHAGLNLEVEDWKNCDWKRAVWTKTREFRKVDLTKHGINKSIVHGHVSTRNLRDDDNIDSNDFSVYRSPDKQKIGIDGSVMKTKRINVLVIED